MNARPEARYVGSDYDEQPISRTYQYRKVMKPMLERKRRARINRCLDSLKELMVTTLQAEGENVSKLEKADILELTVQHLHKLRRQHALGLTPEVAYADRFRAGFTHCAAEVSQYLATNMSAASGAEPPIDPNSGVKLLQHLSSCIRRIDENGDPEVMKPMLERKRRARINRCLDSLKELMVTTLQAEGENVSKLEKADILELTVQHLHKLRRQHALGLTPEVAYADRFRAGFTHCAAEVSQYLATNMSAASGAEPPIDPNSGVKLLQHLSSCIRRIDENGDPEVSNPYTTPPSSPQSPTSPTLPQGITSHHGKEDSSVWRPW